MEPKAKRNRRPLNPAQQWQPGLLLPIVTDFDAVAHTVTIALYFYDASATYDGPVSIKGVPRARLFDGVSYYDCTGIAPGTIPGEWVLAFGSTVPTTAMTLLYPPFDPALRTPQGGYVAPANYSLAWV